MPRRRTLSPLRIGAASFAFALTVVCTPQSYAVCDPTCESGYTCVDDVCVADPTPTPTPTATPTATPDNCEPCDAEIRDQIVFMSRTMILLAGMFFAATLLTVLFRWL